MGKLGKGLLLVLMLALALAGASCGKAPTAKAPEYPTRDITCIVHFKAGGGYDATARMLAPFLEKYLPKKVNVVVKNVAGAGGKVGFFEMYDAAPDGYTIGVVEPQVLCLAQVQGQAGNRDPKEVTYLGRAAHQPYLLALCAANYKSLQELKGKPVRVGVTSMNQAGAIVTLRALGSEPKVMLYDGGPEACLAAMRGEADTACITFTTTWNQVQASKGKLLAALVCDKKRRPEAPDVPVPSEVGVQMSDAELATAAGDYVVAAPPKLPPEIKKILEEAVQKAIHDPEFLAQMDKAQMMPSPLSAEDTAKQVAGAQEVYASLKDMLATGK